MMACPMNWFYRERGALFIQALAKHLLYGGKINFEPCSFGWASSSYVLLHVFLRCYPRTMRTVGVGTMPEYCIVGLMGDAKRMWSALRMEIR